MFTRFLKFMKRPVVSIGMIIIGTALIVISVPVLWNNRNVAPQSARAGSICSLAALYSDGNVNPSSITAGTYATNWQVTNWLFWDAGDGSTSWSGAIGPSHWRVAGAINDGSTGCFVEEWYLNKFAVTGNINDDTSIGPYWSLPLGMILDRNSLNSNTGCSKSVAPFCETTSNLKKNSNGYTIDTGINPNMIDSSSNNGTTGYGAAGLYAIKEKGSNRTPIGVSPLEWTITGQVGN